jgi:hypothetical protein
MMHRGVEGRGIGGNQPQQHRAAGMAGFESAATLSSLLLAVGSDARPQKSPPTTHLPCTTRTRNSGERAPNSTRGGSSGAPALTHTPNIRRNSILVASQSFRGHVRPSPNKRVGKRVFQLARHSKVAELDLARRVHKDVRRLDIAVNDLHRE